MLHGHAGGPTPCASCHLVGGQGFLGIPDLAGLEAASRARLAARGWIPDYIAIRRRVDLKPVGAHDLARGEPLLVLAAARLGSTRLIDNLEI